jgi:hypothetical protein
MSNITEVYNVGGEFSHTENSTVVAQLPNDGDTLIQSITGADESLSGPIPFVYDASRSNFLSSTMEHIGFSATSVATDDYIPSGASIVGVVLPFDGTIVTATGTTSNSNSCGRSLSIYINGVETATGYILGGSGLSGMQTSTKTDLNIQFNAGDVIQARMRYDSGSTRKNTWTNFSLNVFYKWRTA